MWCVSVSRNICTQKGHAHYIRANVNCLVESHSSAIDGCLSWSIKSVLVWNRLSRVSLWDISVQFTAYSFLNISIYLIYATVPASSVFLYRFGTKILCALHVPTTRAAWPGRRIILDVICLTGLREEYKSWSTALFLHSSLNPFWVLDLHRFWCRTEEKRRNALAIASARTHS